MLADGRLNDRYPGPAPARVVVRGTPAPGRMVVRGTPAAPARMVVRATPAPAARAAAGAPRAPRSGPPPAGAVWLRRAVVVAWVVAGSLVLLLVLSRLFAAAVPTVPSEGGAGVGPQLGLGAPGPYTYQSYPHSRAVPGVVP
ncbi:MAG TPA: hypothetical protein VHZ27_13195 [Solirubrobacteraceae bacterium]|nr:hypothetical protein [Solirubrobacteraceae bacterium]